MGQVCQTDDYNDYILLRRAEFVYVAMMMMWKGVSPWESLEPYHWMADEYKNRYLKIIKFGCDRDKCKSPSDLHRYALRVSRGQTAGDYFDPEIGINPIEDLEESKLLYEIEKKQLLSLWDFCRIAEKYIR